MDYSVRYKECSPLETIERIRKIFARLGILTVEKWNNDVEGYYSLHLMIHGMDNVFSNGKSTTAQYALASAYAELIERLQNLGFAKWNQGMSQKALEYQGFYMAPDERKIDKKELLCNIERWFSSVKCDEGTMKFNKNILEKWRTMGDGDWGNNTGLPYMNITDNHIYYLPFSMVGDIYGSNGMSAGNTASEALVQGLSEVLERYVQRKIILERIIPPTIPDSYISEKYPYLYHMIRELEKKGDFKVIVKDCSLGKGFPVTAIYFLDRSRHSYFIRFGAHPSFDISLERCLTELLQGKNIDDLSWRVPLSFSDEEIFSAGNLNDIFINGAAPHPPEMFMDKFSYEFGGIRDMSGRDNHAMLSRLIGIIESNGGNILIRDVSFLGFPSFHMIVPFMSEMVNYRVKTFSNITGPGRIPSLLMRLEELGGGELQGLVDAILENGCSPKNSIADLFHRSLSSDFPWHRIKLDFFLGCAYYKLGEPAKACKFIERFVKSMKSSKNDAGNAYYNCIKDYFGALACGRNDMIKIKEILIKFYPESIAEEVLAFLHHPDDIFRPYSKLHCFNCKECRYIKHCYYPSMEKLFMKMKDIYAENRIDQRRVASILAEK